MLRILNNFNRLLRKCQRTRNWVLITAGDRIHSTGREGEAAESRKTRKKRGVPKVELRRKRVGIDKPLHWPSNDLPSFYLYQRNPKKKWRGLEEEILQKTTETEGGGNWECAVRVKKISGTT